MRNIRKVNQVNYTTGNGDDAVNHSEIYESDANAAGRMNELMNRDITYRHSDMYEVGTSLGTFAGFLFSSLEVAKNVAIKNYGEAIL